MALNMVLLVKKQSHLIPNSAIDLSNKVVIKVLYKENSGLYQDAGQTMSCILYS
jgi:hypothetical protein